jgi:hypothetical protein
LEEIKKLSEEELRDLEKKILNERPIFVNKEFVMSVKKPKI